MITSMNYHKYPKIVIVDKTKQVCPNETKKAKIYKPKATVTRAELDYLYELIKGENK